MRLNRTGESGIRDIFVMDVAIYADDSAAGCFFFFFFFFFSLFPSSSFISIGKEMSQRRRTFLFIRFLSCFPADYFSFRERFLFVT